MRKATYTIPRAAGDAEDGELSVSQAGGGLDQNLTRWAGQFDQKLADVKREERTTHGLKVMVVEIHGTYKAMAMPGAPPARRQDGASAARGDRRPRRPRRSSSSPVRRRPSWPPVTTSINSSSTLRAK